MSLGLTIFFLGLLGFIFNRKNLILALISLELIVLGVTILILISSFGLNDTVGQAFAVLLISTVGAESAIGLAIVLAYFSLRSLS